MGSFRSTQVACSKKTVKYQCYPKMADSYVFLSMHAWCTCTSSILYQACPSGLLGQIVCTLSYRIAAEAARNEALLRVTRERHARLKLELRKAIQVEDTQKLEPAVDAVKKEGLSGCGDLLAKAERLLSKLKAGRHLKDAVLARRLAGLEQAIGAVRRGGFEEDLRVEMREAGALLETLRKLEQKRKAVLNLSQRVIAEIKSYSKPPTVVHRVMSAVFLLLGNRESDTKSWPATQVQSSASSTYPQVKLESL